MNRFGSMCSMDKCSRKILDIDFDFDSDFDNLFKKDSRNSKVELLSVGYFLIYSKAQKVLPVSKRVFKSVNNFSMVFSLGEKKYKLIGKLGRVDALKLITGYVAESKWETFTDVIEGVKLLYNIFSTVGHYKRFFSSIAWTKVMLNISKLLLSVVGMLKGEVNLNSIISLLLDIYSVYENVSDWKAQSIESAILAGISCFLPEAFVSFIKRMQVFSAVKLCDDASLFYGIVNSFYDILEWISGKVIGGPIIMKFFKDFLEWFTISPPHLLVRDMENLIRDFDNNPKYLMLETNRRRVKALNEKVKQSWEVCEWMRRSKTILEISKRFERIVKICEAYCTQGREEPSCYVFEGPPGCRKSVIVNKLIEILNEPCYCHLVKSVSDGKDWYDNYQNEEIFYMDDVGQQGVSQWRTIINMVSAVKMPLECADASLKDTKFFNSNKILVTTNMFSRLEGLCKNDCISDVKALWRRGFVFDFARVSALGDAMRGNVSFKFFNIISNTWENSFPQYVLDKCPSLSDVSVDCDSRDMNKLLLWMIRIIKSIEFVKKQIFKSSHVDENLIELARLEEMQYLPREENDIIVNEEEHHFRAQGFYDYFIKSTDAVVDEVKRVSSFVLNCGTVLSEVLFSNWYQQFIIESLCVKIKEMSVNIVDNIKENWLLCIPLLIFFIGVIKLIFDKRAVVVNNDNWRTEMLSKVDGEAHNSVNSILKQVFSIDIIIGDKKSECECLASGRHIILPAHILSEALDSSPIFITMYVNRKENKRIIEHELAKIVFKSDKEDLAIIGLPESFASPFKSLAKWFKFDVKESNDVLNIGYLLSSQGNVVPLGKINASWFSRTVRYFYNQWGGDLYPTDIKYDIHGPGMCGAVIFSPVGGILGFHVAGNSSLRQGVARVFCSDTRRCIRDVLMKEYYQIPYDLKEQKDSNTSVMKLDFKSHASVPSKTNFVASPLFDYFEGSREPANLTLTGKFTVKDVAKKSFSTTGSITTSDFDFGCNVLRSIIDDYDDLDEQTVVGGDDLLAGLNKDSSNGYGQLKDKVKYVDFENKCYTQLLKDELSSIRHKVSEYTYPIDKFVWAETLKDELRGVEKQGEPRSFRVATIQNQVLCKEKFGNMVKNILRNRDYNRIMVGVNPFKDWDKIYNELSKCELVMAADIKKYDGKMLPQVQRMVYEILLEKYVGSEKKLCSFLLENLVHTFLYVMDDTYLTTHSFPSGHFLTAIVNSLVNRVYTAIWYKRMMEKKGVPYSVSSFNEDVLDYVYGDDKLNGFKRHCDVLNAISLRDFFQDIGLDLTTSQKKEIVEPGERLEDLEFLKRKFVFHPKIGRVMCPLDMRTLNSGLRFCDITKNVEQVMQDKIHNYQREIYLHSNYASLLKDFCQRMSLSGVNYTLLPECYLLLLYTDKSELSTLDGVYK